MNNLTISNYSDEYNCVLGGKVQYFQSMPMIMECSVCNKKLIYKKLILSKNGHRECKKCQKIIKTIGKRK